jgi:hypothetical protein
MYRYIGELKGRGRLGRIGGRKRRFGEVGRQRVETINARRGNEKQ